MGLLEQSRLQINYRNPVYLDGRLFFIKEQQMDVEWLQQESDNWTQIAHSRDLLIGDDWIPIKTTVLFMYADDPTRFQAQFIVTYAPRLPSSVPQINLDALYASSLLLISGVGQGLFFRELFNVSVAYLWLGVPNWAEERWTFAWTPGLGDGTAAGVWSYERTLQQYIDLLVEKGIIS